MLTCRCILFGILIVSATGLQGLEEINILEILQSGINRSSGAKLSKCGEAFVKMNWTKHWTRAMFDASSKLQSGVLAGNTYDLGAYDECLSIDDKIDEVKGKYCLGKVQVRNSSELSKIFGIESENNETRKSGRDNLVLTWSICIPDVCTADELNKELIELPMVFWTFHEASCQTAATQPILRDGDYCAIVFFIITGFIMLLSTLYDILLYYKDEQAPYPVLLAFSAFTNGRKLFQVVKNPQKLECVEGLRAISMMWIVVLHVFTRNYLLPQINSFEIEEWNGSLASMYKSPAVALAVDTFLLLGGTMITYTYLCSRGQFEVSNIPSYYLHRYLRLTPVLAVVLLFNVTLYENIGSGPLWNGLSRMYVNDCRKYWWSTLLYIQNYANNNNICMPVSWYLSVDMQLFVLSPFILIPLKKYTKRTLGVVVFLAYGSIALAVYVVWHYRLNALYGGGTYYTKYYRSLWTRANPWLIGILLGCMVYKVKNARSVKICKPLVAILWIASLTVLCCCVFCGNELKTNQSHNLVATTLYTSFVRPIWSIGVSWVVFACVSGQGGPINSFLSLPIFQILDRVSYTIYLTHYHILSMIMFSTRFPLRFSHLSIMINYWSYFMVTFFVSVVFHLAFESPIIVIEKAIKSRDKTRIVEPEVPPQE